MERARRTGVLALMRSGLDADVDFEALGEASEEAHPDGQPCGARRENVGKGREEGLRVPTNECAHSAVGYGRRELYRESVWMI